MRQVQWVQRVQRVRQVRRCGVVDLRGHIVLPGFIDVHVHGLEGIDTLDGGDVDCRDRSASAEVWRDGVLSDDGCVRTGRAARGAAERRAASNRARTPALAVLPAHLESNFINPDFRGAQPPRASEARWVRQVRQVPGATGATGASCEVRGAGDFDGRDIVAEIDAAGASVGIVTLAPELDGALDLIRHLVSRGRRVSLGHSGATLAQARAAIEAGARHATHLFNRMPPLGHREPGLAGAILTSDDDRRRNHLRRRARASRHGADGDRRQRRHAR